MRLSTSATIMRDIVTQLWVASDTPLSSRWIRLLALSAFILVLTACSDKSADSPRGNVDAKSSASSAKDASSNATPPQWVTQANPHRKVAVVFVHGIFGDTLGTWSSDGGKPSFFKLLETVPDVGRQLDMYAFGFTSNMFSGGSLDIRESANKLHEYLQFGKVLDYPTVVFVAHSMGGLIVLRELINHREILAKVPLIVLLATPQEGAQISQIANVVAKNPALAEMFPADRNGYLQSLDEDWKRLPGRPYVSCGYEKLETYGVMIVPWSSATRFCDGAAIAIDGANHISIVKPDRGDHGSIVLLTNALNAHVLGRDVVARLETPDFAPSGDHYVFKLSAPIGRSSARLVNAGRNSLRYTIGQVSDHNLYLWPDDTPRELPGKSTGLMQLALGFGASANEYQFVLQSDVSADQRIVVQIADMAAFRKRQKEIADAMSREVASYLADPANLAQLVGLKINDAKAEEALVAVVADSIAKQSPELPQHARWIMSADFLNASNMPQLAATALRRAETISPASARSSNVQWLGGVVAAQSGQAKIFESTTTPALTEKQVRSVDYASRPLDTAPESSREELAQRLKEIPAFKAYGLSLEGDILRSAGKTVAARAAYVEAANLQRSPSIDFRIEALTKR